MVLTSFDDFLDEQYPPGSSERAEFDAYAARFRRRLELVDRLTGWLGRIGPHWTHDTLTIDDEVIETKYGVGQVAMYFWSDILTTLLSAKDNGRLRPASFGHALYAACDGLAFQYLDDAYVPTFTDVRAAGSRRGARFVASITGRSIERRSSVYQEV